MLQQEVYISSKQYDCLNKVSYLMTRKGNFIGSGRVKYTAHDIRFDIA